MEDNFNKSKELTEMWKDVSGYENRYKISNSGKVFSIRKDRMLNLRRDTRGYCQVFLSKEKQSRNIKTHILVWEHFGNKPRDGRKLQVDHIDENKLNNRIDNLQLLTNRQNINKSHSKRNKSSRYEGTFYDNYYKKYKSKIYIDGKNIDLGYHKREILAALAYQKAKIKYGVF